MRSAPSTLTKASAWVKVGAKANNTATNTDHHTAQGRRSCSVRKVMVICCQFRWDLLLCRLAVAGMLTVHVVRVLPC